MDLLWCLLNDFIFEDEYLEMSVLKNDWLIRASKETGIHMKNPIIASMSWKV